MAEHEDSTDVSQILAHHDLMQKAKELWDLISPHVEGLSRKEQRTVVRELEYLMHERFYPMEEYPGLDMPPAKEDEMP